MPYIASWLSNRHGILTSVYLDARVFQDHSRIGILEINGKRDRYHLSKRFYVSSKNFPWGRVPFIWSWCFRGPIILVEAKGMTVKVHMVLAWKIRHVNLIRISWFPTFQTVKRGQPFQKLLLFQKWSSWTSYLHDLLVKPSFLQERLLAFVKISKKLEQAES